MTTAADVSDPVLQHPHPLLRTVCEPVTEFGAPAILLEQRMFMAMYAASRVTRGIGLAANQIGVTKRMVVLDIDGAKRTLVNPVIVRASGEQRLRDGCLSVKWGTDFRVRTRPASIYVEFQDVNGDSHGRPFKGMWAAAIAHEVDHLNGILFIDALTGAA